MAITTVNLSALNNAGAAVLSAAGQVAWGPGDAVEPAVVGLVTFTGDGASTTAIFNFIDGTQSIPFLPTGVEVTRIGGTDTAAGLPVVISFTQILVNVAFSVAPASAKTQILAIKLYK